MAGPPGDAPARKSGDRMRGNRSLMVLAGVAAVFLLDFGEPFFVPLFLALFISYALSPVVRALTVVVRWRTVASAIVVFSLIGLVALSAWSWSDDVQKLWEDLPAAAKTVSKNLQKVVRPSGAITEVKKAAADVESMAQTGKAAPQAAVAPANSAAEV